MNRYEIALGKKPPVKFAGKVVIDADGKVVIDADGKVVIYDTYDLQQKWLKENNEGHAHDQEIERLMTSRIPLASEIVY
jgi:hypothetical protein